VVRQVDHPLIHITDSGYNVAGIVNHKFKVLTVAVNTMIYVTVPLLAVSLVLLIVEGL
jgi:hypothetical protein